MKERIQKALASLGLDSRRHIEEMVLAGRVSVNGKIARKLPVMVDVDEDVIEIDGTEVSSPKRTRRRESRDTAVYAGRVCTMLCRHYSCAVPFDNKNCIEWI